MRPLFGLPDELINQYFNTPRRSWQVKGSGMWVHVIATSAKVHQASLLAQRCTRYSTCSICKVKRRGFRAVVSLHSLSVLLLFSFVSLYKVMQWQQHPQDTLHSCLSWTMSKPTGDRLPSYRPTTLTLDLRQCNHTIETTICKMVVVVPVPGTNKMA